MTSIIQRLGLVAVLALASFTAHAEGHVKLGVSLSPTGKFDIEGKEIQGSVSKKGDKYVGANIVVPVSTLKSGIALRDKHVQEYFESATYPKAILKKGVGKDGKFAAILEVHGVPQKIKGTYAIEDGKFVASFKASMAAYKIKKAIYMGIGVKDEIDVVVKIPVK